MTMTDHIEEPETLEQIASKMQDRALELVPELAEMTPEEREQYFQEREAEEQHQGQLLRCAEIAERLIPPVFRRQVELPPAVSRWLSDLWGAELASDPFSKNGLALIGRPGAGKTQTAWSIIASLLQHGWEDFRFEETSDLFDEFTRRSHSKSSDRDFIKSLGEVDILILDDLGAKPLTDFREERLERILNERWKHGRPTIITTNIAAPNFGAHFGDRNASRIAGMCQIVTFPNYDHRSGIDYSKGGSR